MKTRTLSRRALMQQLGLWAAGSRAAFAAGFQATSVNHVSLQVSDLARSSEFYHRVFGLFVQNRDDGTVQLRLGKGSLILRLGNPVGTVDHFGIGVDNFNKESVIRDLKTRGAEPAEDAIALLHVKDLHGLKVQLTDNAGYVHPEAPSSFEGSCLDHVSIYVSDVGRSAEFYERVFGCSALNRDANTLRLSLGTCHITLRKGDPPGKVDHFAIGIDHFEEASAIRELRARGAEAVDQGDAGLHVKDPDGYPVQVIANSPG